MSRHHWYIMRIVVVAPNIIRKFVCIWNILMVPTIMFITLIAPMIGQGLTSTK